MDVIDNSSGSHHHERKNKPSIMYSTTSVVKERVIYFALDVGFSTLAGISIGTNHDQVLLVIEACVEIP